MKIISLFLVLFLSCVSFYAQDKKESAETKTQFDLNFDDGCGNPMVESQIYGYRSGKVIKITESNDLIVKITHSTNVWDDRYKKGSDKSELIKPQTFKVFLVGIDKNYNGTSINKFLNEKVLNQQVRVVGNTKNSRKIEKDNTRELFAVVLLLSGDEDLDYITKYLLENGIARFEDFSLTNLVPMRTHCELERAGERAKEAKLGIWAK